MKNYQYIVLDCSALGYANAHTLKGLKAGEIETGVIFGFLSRILELSEKFKTRNFVFAWDSAGSLRRDFFPEYKEKRRAKRKTGTEEEKKFYASIATQLNKLEKHILPQIGFSNSFSAKGYEADDIIADIVMGYGGCLIVTNDEDMFQLLHLSDIFKPTKQELWDKELFVKTYGIQPEQWEDIKAIGGCTTDEVPGIPGVGEGRALQWIKGEMKSTTKAFQAISIGGEIIERNRKLVKIPFPGCPEFEIKRDVFSIEGLNKVAEEYWIDSFLSKVGQGRWLNMFARRAKPIV